MSSSKSAEQRRRKKKRASDDIDSGFRTAHHDLEEEDLSALDNPDALAALFAEALNAPADEGEPAAEPQSLSEDDGDGEDSLDIDLDGLFDGIEEKLDPDEEFRPADLDGEDGGGFEVDEEDEDGDQEIFVGGDGGGGGTSLTRALSGEHERLRAQLATTRGVLVTRENELAEAEERLMKLEQQLRATTQALRGAKGDLDAGRRRSEREREEAKKYGAEKALKELLGVYDNLERALQHSGEARNSPLGQGVEMTLNQFLGSLKRCGATAIEAGPGVTFDPNVHEAVGQAASDDVSAGGIVLVMQSGFTLHDRLLRAAMVSVSAGPGPAPVEPPGEPTPGPRTEPPLEPAPASLDPAGGAEVEVVLAPKPKPKAKPKAKRKRGRRTTKRVTAKAVAAAKEMAAAADPALAPWEDSRGGAPSSAATAPTKRSRSHKK